MDNPVDKFVARKGQKAVVALKKLSGGRTRVIGRPPFLAVLERFSGMGFYTGFYLGTDFAGGQITGSEWVLT